MITKWKDKKIGLLLGGITKEREISLKTGAAIGASLKRQGYNVAEIDADFNVASRLSEVRPDVAFIALHGKFGEDGCIQGLLEMLRIPYTGSGVLASAVAMDKIICNRLAKDLNVTIPEEQSFEIDGQNPEEIAKRVKLPCPVVVKPSREGSTINLSVVHSPDKIAKAIGLAALSDSKIIVQEYIKGTEVTVGLINGEALPVLEIAPKSGLYDYKSKYTKGMTEYILPARISKSCADKVSLWSESISNALGCSGAARCDYIVRNGEAYFLEINTIPGMTELSLVPMAAKHVGISFDELVERILDTASLKINI